MAVNAQPLPTGWIKEGMIVRCMAPVGLMLVKHVDDSGVDARRVRSSKLDAFHMPHRSFSPATIEDRILFTLDDAKISEIRKVIRDGKDERQFKVIFLDHPATVVIDKMKPLFDKVESTKMLGMAVVVTVPQSWLDELVIPDPITPAVLARAAAETDLILEKAAASAPKQRPAPVVADSAVVDWFTRMFTKHGVDMTGVKIAPAHRLGRAMGQDPTYALFWPSTKAFGDNIKLISAAARELHLRDFFANDVKIMVDLPANWTPTYGEVERVSIAIKLSDYLTDDDLALSEEQAYLANLEREAIHKVYAADSEEIAAQVDGNGEPVVKDEDLRETSRLIDDLRERNKRLQAEVESLGTLADDRLSLIDSLTAEIDARDLRAQDASEAYEAADLKPAPAQSLTTCKEVVTLIHAIGQPEERVKGDTELSQRLNDGWQKFECAFVGNQGERTIRYVTLVRDLPAPAAPPAQSANKANARLIEKIGPHIIVEPSQNQAINYGAHIAPVRAKQIAEARATFEAMLNDDEVNHIEFTDTVRRSRLPRTEQDDLIAQSFKIRSGKAAGETFASMKELLPFVRSPFAASLVVKS
jgi:hypothetical protein